MAWATSLGRMNAASLATFGQSATLSLPGIGDYAINGILDATFTAQPVYGMPMEREAPQLQVKTADLGTVGIQAGRAVKHGDGLATGGRNFEIVGLEPDDSGMTRLILRDA